MIALIFCGELRYCPYISRYIQRLKEKKIEYKVYFWNRSGKDILNSPNYISYNKQSELNKGISKKLTDFVGYRSWVIRMLKKDRPSKVILLDTLTGILVGSTVKRMKSPYVLDIRDYSYESIPLFRYIEKKVIRGSSFTAISSRGFLSFLPEHDYVVAHNINLEGADLECKMHAIKTPVRLVWNGVMRYFDFQRQYIDCLKNDNRFLMVYHGDGPELEQYKEYCKKEKISNVIFTGAYDNADKEKLLLEADVINNSYGYLVNPGNKVKYAVSNKFYDGILHHIPQLVEPEGFKTDWVNSTGTGFSFSPDENFADRLYTACTNLNPEQFDCNCSRVLSEILNDDRRYVEAIDNFIL